MFGLTIAVFPFVYRGIGSLSLPRTNPNPAKTIATATDETVDRGPIKIDPALLSLKEPSQPPERIIIPGQKINLPVIEAPVINGYWELSETTASHGVGSANPGDLGNTVVFAHARIGLFYNLRDVTIGDEVLVLTKDHWFRYQVKEVRDVDPNQVEVIAPTSDEALTLYTCSGFMDTKRRIVVAKRWL